MLDHGQTVRNAFFLTSRVEHVRHVGSCRPIRVARRGPRTRPFSGQAESDWDSLRKRFVIHALCW